MEKKEVVTICPESQQEWRNWLMQHHETEQSVWVIYYKKSTGRPSMSWSDAVDEALCFGWIDSTRKTVDSERFQQFFSKRKPTSAWSKINKEKVERLTAAGLMAEAGLNSIATAKKNGSWDLLNTVEDLIVPEDLEKAFKAHPGSKDFYTGLSKSVRKMILYRLVLAKRPETRQKRIDEIAELAAQNKLPKLF